MTVLLSYFSILDTFERKIVISTCTQTSNAHTSDINSNAHTSDIITTTLPDSQTSDTSTTSTSTTSENESTTLPESQTSNAPTFDSEITNLREQKATSHDDDEDHSCGKFVPESKTFLQWF